MGVKGRLNDMGLSDILHILHAEQRTVGLHLGSEKGFGQVYIKHGEVVHAAYRDKSGIEAFKELMSWHEGDFDVEPGEPAPEESISPEFEAFNWLINESIRGADSSPVKGAEYKGDLESAKLFTRLVEMGILERVKV
jgi:hypothetical protein